MQPLTSPAGHASTHVAPWDVHTPFAVPATIGGSCDSQHGYPGESCLSYWGGAYGSASAVATVCNNATFVDGGCPATGVVGYCVANNGVGNYAQYTYGATSASTVMSQCTSLAHGTWCVP